MCLISQLIHHLLKRHFDSVSKAIIKQQKATQTLKGPFFQDFLKVKANRNVKPLSERGSESDFYVKSWDEFMQALRDSKLLIAHPREKTPKPAMNSRRISQITMIKQWHPRQRWRIIGGGARRLMLWTPCPHTQV